MATKKQDKQRWVEADDALWLRIKVAAIESHKTLKAWIIEALEEKLGREDKKP